MSKKRTDFSLGLWLIIVFVLFFGAVIFIGGQSWGEARRAYKVRFPVTYALPDEIKPGSQIFCGASMVGTVKDIELRAVTAEGEKQPVLWAYLDIRVNSLIDLRKDCRILARGPLLGGSGKLAIQDPGKDGAPLPEGALIDGAATGSLDEALDMLNAELDPQNAAGLLALVKHQLDVRDKRSIMAKVHSSLDDLNNITVRLAHQLDESDREVLLAKLHGVLDNINQTTAALRAEMDVQADGALLAKVHGTLDAVGRGLDGVVGMVEENRPGIHATLETVQRAVGTVEGEIIQPLTWELNRTNTGSLLNQLHTSFERVNHSLANIKVISEKTKTGVVLNEGRFDQLMMNLTETSVHLKGASKDLRRNPWRLFYRPSLEETKQLNIFDAAREFAEAASSLDDSATRLKALLAAADGNLAADDPKLQAIYDRLEQTFEDYTHAEEALWKQLEVR